MLLGVVPGARAAPPQRIVTLAPHLAELVCAVGACGRIVGVVAWSDHPESLRTRPHVGDAFAVNVEQVVGLRPDLVLAWEGGTPRETQERLRGLGLSVEGLEIRRLEDVAGALRSLGARLGTAAEGARAATRYERRLGALRDAHAGAAPVRVLYQIEVAPLYSVNRDSPISQAIALCGGVNVFADLPTLAAPVSREAVIARDPEVILFARQDDAAAIRDAWRRAPPVTATRQGALYEVDGNLLDRATPRLLDGVTQVCGVLNDARAKRRATASPRRPSSGPVPATSRTGNPTAD